MFYVTPPQKNSDFFAQQMLTLHTDQNYRSRMIIDTHKTRIRQAPVKQTKREKQRGLLTPNATQRVKATQTWSQGKTNSPHLASTAAV